MESTKISSNIYSDSEEKFGNLKKILKDERKFTSSVIFKIRGQWNRTRSKYMGQKYSTKDGREEKE